MSVTSAKTLLDAGQSDNTPKPCWSDSDKSARIPQGYKQTEVGVIPMHWEVLPFIEIVGQYIDYRGRTPKKLGLDWGDGEILALSANNVQMGKINPDKEAYLGSEELYKKWMVQGECEKGDILLTMEAPLGNIAQIPDSRKYILSQRVLLIKTKNWLLKDFFAHYMKGSFFQNELLLNSTGSTAKGIQRKKLDDIKIYFPPTKAEQEAIAEALSDADALIESLEQLITKKRQIKQGTMQELLTGKKRLPGFSGEWEVKRFEDVLKIRHGKSQHEIVVAGGKYPILASGGEIGRTNDFLYNKPSVLIGRKGTIDVPQFIDSPFWTIDTLFFTEITQDTNPKFIFYKFNTINWRSYNEASGVPSLSASRIESIEFKCPPLPEQTAIATILSDMDAEIAALETKHAKTRSLKQGMMYNLLTGKIRLI